MSGYRRDEQLESLHNQLEEWQHNLALRVAGEAQALDVEIHKLSDDEIDEVWEVLRTAHNNCSSARTCSATYAAVCKPDPQPTPIKGRRRQKADHVHRPHRRLKQPRSPVSVSNAGPRWTENLVDRRLLYRPDQAVGGVGQGS